ncbi:MAG: 2-C-methyl-D-erythritol 4-phosphate cytidylyltransferase [Firmicutes bacterium]|nr:2-C-methyl-D-erythritol 4-phosphate cytidylyltransferase [Bacillota bacterium]
MRILNFFKRSKNTSVKTAAIIVAAGSSSRMNHENKLFIDILGKPALAYTLEAFQDAALIDEIIIVSKQQDILVVSDIIKAFNITKATAVIPGGETRTQSVRAGLDSELLCDYVAIHDGARPCILAEHIDKTVSAAITFGAAALGCKVFDTLKRVNDDLQIKGTINRDGVWQIQTPQVFKSDIIKDAYAYALENGIEATDDCGLVENTGVNIAAVEGSRANIKITHHDDVPLAAAIIAQQRGSDFS